MKLEIEIRGQTRRVELTREGDRWVCLVDGRAVAADVVEVVHNTYSVLLAGRVFEVQLQPDGERLRVHVGGEEFRVEVADPRAWRRKRHHVLEAEGQQQISAPMPGKVVRVLVQAGAKVEAGQGLLVVEAMKMQNEIRSPKTGNVERILVSEGQAVNAGEVLAVVV